MIRVAIVDDHAALRQPLAFMLEREPDITVVAEAGSLAEARGIREGVDILIVDVDLPDGSGIDLVRDLRDANFEGMVLVLTDRTNRAEVARAVEAGASGVLDKSAGVAQIIDAVRRLNAGEHLLPPPEMIELLRLASRLREREQHARAILSRLTPRELEVLQALGDGLNDKEIAVRLHISAETVRTHMVRILGKLGVDSRLRALVFAVRHGAVTIA